MVGPKFLFVLFFVLLLCSIHPAQGKGGRGGGSRGGGSRGGSSSGSRGSSSSGSRGSSSGSSSSSSGSSSSSRGSSSSGTQWDRSGSSGSNKPSPPKSSIGIPKPPQPSAPELPKANPSAPKTPGQSQPSNPHPYNPNFQQPQPDSGVRVNPPSHGNAPPGNLPPYSPRENPPPYSPGNPPPYAPGNHPLYPPGNNPPVNPPPYGSGLPGNPPPYGVNIPQGSPYSPGNRPPYPPGNNPPPYGSGPPGNPPPYGVNIPQGPSYGQPSYGGVNRPQANPPPYGVNPLPGHGIPHGGQPSSFPYPRQPGMSYPPGGSGWSYYYPPGGIQNNPSVKPHKKKGLLGGMFSFGKKPKHPKISSPVGSFGMPSHGKHGMSPINMILPLAAMKKPHKPFHFKHHYWVLPYAVHRRSKWGGIDFDYDDDDFFDDYGRRRRCFRPRAPIGGSISCEHTLQKIECRARCQDGYTFPDNTTELEVHCWRFSGHWSRSRFLPRCQPFCKPEECQNGGTCTAPGQCRCSFEYRGDHCEHPFLNCDILKFSKGSKTSWVCSHTRNDTVCRVRCRSPLVFETPAAEQYHCHLNGTWTPDRIPKCVQEAQSTEGTPTTTFLTEASQEE